MEWVLILGMWAGTLSTKDSMSLQVAQFSTQEKCEVAGKLAQKKFSTLMKTVEYVCVQK